jgi:hypothetical protein
MPTPAGEAVVRGERAGVCTWSGAGFCVHPATRTPAKRQTTSMITTLFLDIMVAS